MTGSYLQQKQVAIFLIFLSYLFQILIWQSLSRKYMFSKKYFWKSDWLLNILAEQVSNLLPTSAQLQLHSQPATHPQLLFTYLKTIKPKGCI